MSNDQILTLRGVFRRDDFGLYQYTTRREITLSEAVSDALGKKPDAPAWFWYKQIPTPMRPGDSEVTLYRRWIEWHEAFRLGKVEFLDKFIRASGQQ